MRDKVVLITGGANGIGLAIAKRFSNEGAIVYIADLDLLQARERTKGTPNSIPLELDVSNQASIANMVNLINDDRGYVDVLVNCAGVYHFSALEDITVEDYDRVFNTNVKGTLFTTQAVSALMGTRQCRGKIINIASLAARRGTEFEPLYCASKAALVTLTQSLALYLIKRNINVNAISPGLVKTSMFENVVSSWANMRNVATNTMVKTIENNIPIGYISDPEDITGCALWLSSSDSDYVIGQTINVDGGKWMS